MQILFNFPEVTNNFKPAYDGIQWLNNEDDFKRCSGTTGYQWWTLECVNNETGYMHNRVRMVVASFLCKHLLINWQWEKLILLKSYWIMKCHLMWQWQWAAGTGCDATPYFRVFNPSIQLKKFDEKVFILGSGFLNLNSVTESLW
jgi:deoxyribodipyrimidine photo-lyase